MAKARAAQVEELEDELEEVEEADDDLEDVEEVAPKAKAKGKKAAAAAPKEKATADGFGVAWLSEHIAEVLDKQVTATSLRVLLRKMAAEGELEREVGTDRARYSFSGSKDPIVREVVKRIKSGALERSKNDNLEKARAAKLAKKATAAAVADDADDAEEVATPVKTRKKVAAAAPPAKKATRKRAG